MSNGKPIGRVMVVKKYHVLFYLFLIFFLTQSELIELVLPQAGQIGIEMHFLERPD